MKAIRFDRFGGPEVPRPVDMPDPVPGRGGVLVEVRAVSVVAGDCKLRNREMTGPLAPRPPRVPGRDGDRGSYAELALRQPPGLASKPAMH